MAVKKTICSILALGCCGLYFYFAVSLKLPVMLCGSEISEALPIPLITVAVASVVTGIISLIGELKFLFIVPGIINLLVGYDMIIHGDFRETGSLETVFLYIVTVLGVCFVSAFFASIAYKIADADWLDRFFIEVLFELWGGFLLLMLIVHIIYKITDFSVFSFLFTNF